MRCFNHPDREAIGLCKSCYKGLCPECATDLGHGLACKGRHEEDVKVLDGLIARSAKVYSVTPKSRFVVPLFYAFMGAIFAGFGLAQGVNFAVVMGIGLLVFAVVTHFYNRKAYGAGRAEQSAKGGAPPSG